MPHGFAPRTYLGNPNAKTGSLVRYAVGMPRDNLSCPAERVKFPRTPIVIRDRARCGRLVIRGAPVFPKSSVTRSPFPSSPMATQSAATSPICSPKAAGTISQAPNVCGKASRSMTLRMGPSKLSPMRQANPPSTIRCGFNTSSSMANAWPSRSPERRRILSATASPACAAIPTSRAVNPLANCVCNTLGRPRCSACFTMRTASWAMPPPLDQPSIDPALW